MDEARPTRLTSGAMQAANCMVSGTKCARKFVHFAICSQHFCLPVLPSGTELNSFWDRAGNSRTPLSVWGELRGTGVYKATFLGNC